MPLLGIISGTIPIAAMALLGPFEERVVDTPFGSATVLVSERVAIIPRHGRDAKKAYTLPHMINHQANLTALAGLGVEEVIGANSTGSLKLPIKPGTIVLPDDFIMIYPGPTTAGRTPLHITPGLSERVRRKLLEACGDCGLSCRDGGVYWQTPGPRLETKAEIAMMAGVADLVGMTMASEAIVACELGLEYASICSVDNYAHGLRKEPLQLTTIIRHARKNAGKISRVITKYVEKTAL